jgi:hypothetical protein
LYKTVSVVFSLAPIGGEGWGEGAPLTSLRDSVNR